jgi:Fic family protein
LCGEKVTYSPHIMRRILLFMRRLNAIIIKNSLDGFNGKLTTSKWAKITKCSQDTAYRDILDLIDRGILTKNSEGGRSTSYSLVTRGSKK